MSAITEKEFNNHEKVIQVELWNFRKKYFHGEDSDDYWRKIIEESDRISRKYNSPYVDNMLIICIEDIETRYRESAGNTVNKLEHFDHIVNILRRNYE